MKLLTSQKDTLYELIENVGLSPNQFEFKLKPNTYSSTEIDTELIFIDTEYFFLFSTSINSYNSHSCIFCPGENSHTSKEGPCDWENQISHFRMWLLFLVRELNSPNKWDRLKIEILNLNINFETDINKFSIQEYKSLEIKISNLKDGLSKIGLLEIQVETINKKLDHLLELAKDLSKFDWFGLFIGTILNIIIQLGVTKENSKLIWDLIKNVFKSYLLP